MKQSVLFSSVILLGSLSWSASATTYSGTDLSGLDYSAYPPGTAQYVPAVGLIPAYAALATPDAGLGPNSGDAAVYVGGSLGAVKNFTGSFDILSSSGGAGNQPYWLLWMNADGTGGPLDASALAIIGYGGSIINGSSQIHVYDPNNVAPSYFGDTLASILNDTDTATGVKFGDMLVADAGVGIGDWNIDDTIGATADIDSITVNSSVPDATSTLFLSSLGFAGLLAFRLGGNPKNSRKA